MKQLGTINVISKSAVGELTSPRVDPSATWLTASWFVGKLCGYCSLQLSETYFLEQFSEVLTDSVLL